MGPLHEPPGLHFLGARGTRHRGHELALRDQAEVELRMRPYPPVAPDWDIKPPVGEEEYDRKVGTRSTLPDANRKRTWGHVLRERV
jgi:hypothetical protein